MRLIDFLHELHQGGVLREPRPSLWTLAEPLYRQPVIAVVKDRLHQGRVLPFGFIRQATEGFTDRTYFRLIRLGAFAVFVLAVDFDSVADDEVSDSLEAGSSKKGVSSLCAMSR